MMNCPSAEMATCFLPLVSTTSSRTRVSGEYRPLLSGPRYLANLQRQAKCRSHSACDALSGTWIAASLERVKGIEPSYSAWEAAALPLSYTRARIRHRIVRSGCQAPAGFVIPRENAWRASVPAPDSWSRGRCHRGLPVSAACARKQAGQRSARVPE